MLRTLVPAIAIPTMFGATLAFAAPLDRPEAPPAKEPPVTSGSSATVPPGKVMLPPLPLAKMPDTSMPKEPTLAPLPDTGAARQR